MKTPLKILWIAIFVLALSTQVQSAEYNYIRINSATPAYYNTIQEAYNAAAEGDTIQLQGVWFPEDLSFNRDISVTITGGYDTSFTDNSGDNSVFISWPQITQGHVYLNNIAISSPGLANYPGDSESPQCLISINEGHSSTNLIDVTLAVSATDNASGLDQVCFSNDNISYSTPEDYIITKAWILTTGDGAKTVYVKFSDRAGNWSDAYSDTILLDSSPDTVVPEIININPSANSKFTENEGIQISLTVNDSDPSPLDYRFLVDDVIIQDWSSEPSCSWVTSKGLSTIRAEVWDLGGTDTEEIEICVFREPIEPSD